MDPEIIASPDEPLKAVLARRQALVETQHPDTRMVDSVVLKDGPRAHKVATRWIIVDRHTGKPHHNVIRISTFTKRKAGWSVEDEHSITLDDKDHDEIGALATFIGAIKNTDISDAPGRDIGASAGTNQLSADSMRELLNIVSVSEKAGIIVEALSAVKGDAQALRSLMQSTLADPQASVEVAAALRVASFTEALRQLRQLIETDAPKSAFQALLASNPWMFGSDYSELLDQRRWTRDEQQDFMLRRTIDGCLEIVEIKTPLQGKPLFVSDPSHATVYARSELTVVLGQVMHAIEKLDAEQYSIHARGDEDVRKIRAKIIIGRSGDTAQAEALRRLNGHLHRIEVLTFDQLVRIADQTVKALEQIIDPARAPGRDEE